MPHSRSLTIDTLLRAPTAIRKLLTILVALTTMVLLAAIGRAQTFPDVRWMRAGQTYGAGSAAFYTTACTLPLPTFETLCTCIVLPMGCCFTDFPQTSNNNVVAFAADGSLLIMDQIRVSMGGHFYNLVTYIRQRLTRLLVPITCWRI